LYPKPKKVKSSRHLKTAAPTTGKSTVAYVLAASLLPLLCALSQYAAWADPDSAAYKKAMKAFSAGDYKTSQTLFDSVVRGDGTDANAMYMEALSYQRLGQNDRARMLYRTCCTNFPYSGACERAQEALRTMDPVFLKTFLKNRPPDNSQSAPLGTVTTVSAVAPQWGWSTRPLTQEQQKERKKRVYEGGVFQAKISGALMDCIYDKNQKRSYIGFNQLAAYGLKPRGAVGSLYIGDVDIDMTATRQFHFITKKFIPGPVIFGQDFKDAWDYTIAISNPLTAGRFISREKKAYMASLSEKAKEFEGKPEGLRDHTTNDKEEPPEPNDNTDPKVHTFQISYRPLTDYVDPSTQKREVRRVVTAYVDGQGIDMMFCESGITTFGIEQMMTINPSYIPSEFKTDTSVAGVQLKTSAEIVLRQLRLGKIDRYHVPAILEAYSSPRFQAPRGGPEIPLLGSNFLAGWTWKADDQRRIITFTRMR
jgi:hypothetical protein